MKSILPAACINFMCYNEQARKQFCLLEAELHIQQCDKLVIQAYKPFSPAMNLTPGDPSLAPVSSQGNTKGAEYVTDCDWPAINLLLELLAEAPRKLHRYVTME